MPALIDSSFAGLLFPITIDGKFIVEGEDADIFPASLQATPSPIEDHVDTADGGSQTIQPGFGLGHPDYANRWNFTMTFNDFRGPMKTLMERLLVRGVYHTFTYWKPYPASWTGDGSRVDLYLPHYRGNAPQVISDLVYRGIISSTDTFPTIADIDDVSLTLDYQTGPVLTDPGAGKIAISATPDSTGHYPIKLHEPIAEGSVLTVTYYPLFACTMMAEITFPQAGVESHVYRLLEI